MELGIRRAVTSVAMALGLAVAGAGTAMAAALIFDDTNPNDLITVSANDFEGGLIVNGNLFQQGLNNPATGDFSEQNPVTFSGRWIDLGQSGTGSRTIYLVEHWDPTVVSDIFRYSWSTSGGFGTIEGSFVSDFENNLGTLPPGVNPGDVFVEEDGLAVGFSLPFLGGVIRSDAPEPASLGLLGLGLAALAASRRRKQ